MALTQRIVHSTLYNKLILRLMSTETLAKPKRPTALRTSADPLSHEEKHVGHFYTIPQDTLNSFFAFGGFPSSYKENIKTFGEASIMIRSPAVEIINYLNKTNYDHPVVRYVIYGKRGHGKSVTVAHLLHYAYLANFVVVHVPWVWNWYRRDRIEVAVSDTKPGLYNLPVEAANWLKYFQKQNAHILSSPDLRLTKEYTWSPREKTPANAPLQELVTHGIGRIRYACDVVDVLINELKSLSSLGRCKTLIAIDGFNLFFLPSSLLKNPEKRRIVPDQVTLAQTFLSAVQADWKNGAVIVTVDTRSVKDVDTPEKPLHLLGKRGFEALDPFVPVEVPPYSEIEFNNILDYYEDRRWIQRPGAREELDFISARNPYYLMNLCASL